MRYVGDLLTECQRDTNNVGSTSTSGVDPEDFLRYFNYAQERIQSLVQQSTPVIFQTEEILSIVALQEAYSVTGPIYMGTRIVNVEYSPTSLTRDYYKIYERGIFARDTYPQNYPVNYSRRGSQILLIPTPSVTQGSIRVTYERELDRLDTRRATISGTPSGAVIVTTGADITSLPTNLTNARYVCVSDADGNILLYNGLVSSWSSPNLTLAANVSTYLTTGYALADLAGKYLTVQKYSTTHSKLANLCERYLQAYCNWKVLGRDAATKAKAKMFEDELTLIEQDIVRGYQEPDKDDDNIQIVNEDLMV